MLTPSCVSESTLDKLCHCCEDVPMESLTTRPAQCYCGREAPIGTPIRTLAFYEHRGPGTQDERCANCRYNECAHDAHLSEEQFHMKWGLRKPIGLGRANSLVCDNFQPMTEGYAYDIFYCGCRGWD